ncbi:MAG: SdrD B-like domain-containing protein [Armatimonadota bacterium]|nr:SdrD B-like domain-containing protein [Armatimonadota bacterium]MDR5697243.1 SdrD B-like domain-containing protein [Armatimonadota bacterium]
MSKAWRGAAGLALVTLALAAALPAAPAPAVRLFLDGSPLGLRPAPLLVDGLVYLPLRPLAALFGAEVVARPGIVEVRKADANAYTLRPGRSEVWQADLVIAVLPGPVRVMNGSTRIPHPAAEVLFDVLVDWDPASGRLSITTADSAQTTTVAASRPRATPRPGGTTDFVSEFRQDLTPPVFASGHVVLGLSFDGRRIGPSVDLTFGTLGLLADRTSGRFYLGAFDRLTYAGSAMLEWSDLRLHLGEVVLDDSPLTLYEQGLVGAIAQTRVGSLSMVLWGGALPGAWTPVYGAQLRLPRMGDWSVGATLLYDPASTAFVVKSLLRWDPFAHLALFAEVATGGSPEGSGFAWRAGAAASFANLGAELSYLWLGPGFPTMGNATQFADRHGGLLRLFYVPDDRWYVAASAAFLRANAPGTADRSAYGLLATYRASQELLLAGTFSHRDDASVRVTQGSLHALYARSPWAVSLSAGYVLQAGVLGSPSSWRVEVRPVLQLPAGAYLSGELARHFGSPDGWIFGVGGSFRIGPDLHLRAQARYAALDSGYEGLVEIGVARQVGGGASVSVGGGLRLRSGATTPYATVHYAFPLSFRGSVPVGRLEVVVFRDINGDGRRDEDEPGVPDVVIRIDGRRAALSGSGGQATMDPVREGSYTVSVDEDTVPVDLMVEEGALRAQVHAGGTTVVQVALVPAATVRGTVYVDTNNNGRRDPSEPAVEGVILVLWPGEERRTTDERGAFEFFPLRPGDHRVRLLADSLPPHLAVPADGAEFTVRVAPGQTLELAVRLIPRTRPVVPSFP